MTHDLSEATASTTTSYLFGFVSSLILTISAYLLVTSNLLHGWAQILVLAILATTQLVVQLVCFLHLGRRSKSRWNLIIFLFMAVVVVVVVFGSLWIMYNLDYRHPGSNTKSPDEINTYIIKDEGV